jgi:hypothetical protein
VIAVGGAYGTLSEIALALKTGVPVVGIGTWDIDGIDQVQAPPEAVARALALAGRPPRLGGPSRRSSPHT